MQMEKHQEAVFYMYFVILLLSVGVSMQVDINIVDLVYLVVVVCSSLKFILIVNKIKK